MAADTERSSRGQVARIAVAYTFQDANDMLEEGWDLFAVHPVAIDPTSPLPRREGIQTQYTMVKWRHERPFGQSEEDFSADE